MKNKFNKFILGLSIFGALVFESAVRAQDNTNTISLKLLDTATNIVAIPYAKYDLTSKNYGYGVAGLYKVSENFWAGVRMDRIDGFNTSAGVQAQLKQTVQFAGLTFTPFAETSVGIGSSSLYGSLGGGAFFNFYDHAFTRSAAPPITLSIGLIGDYEHVVENGDTSKNSNQINAGPLFHISF